jgi:hypothetical protein
MYIYATELNFLILGVQELYRLDIYRLENPSVWQIPVFRYGLLIRNWAYIEFDTLEKTVLVISKEN